MKVLYFHQYFNTPRAAGGTRSYEMALQLIASGHQVTMICAKSGNGDWDSRDICPVPEKQTLCI